MLLPDLLTPSLPPLVFLLLALALDAVLGGEARGPLQRLPHPVRLIGRLVADLERRLNDLRQRPAVRRRRGVFTVALCGSLCLAAGWLIWLGAAAVPFGWVVPLALATALLAQRSLFTHVQDVADALTFNGLEGGRAAVAHIVGRDVAQLDGAGVARAAIESCAENFSDAVVAPAFWFVLLGLPGMLLYKAVNTMDSMIGYRNPRYLAFGMCAARLDDLLNLIPARLSGLLICAAALILPSADGRGAWRAMRQDADKHRSPNAGWPEAAMAGALGLALAGPRRYPNLTVDDPWIGGGRSTACADDIRRALRVYAAACMLHAGCIAAAAAIVYAMT